MKLFWTPEASAALALDELFSKKANGMVDQASLGRFGRVAGTRELVAHQNYILIYDTVAGGHCLAACNTRRIRTTSARE